jgi:hypothetical protein
VDTPPLISEAQLRFSKEMVSLARECQRLSANAERVFGNYIKATCDLNDPTTIGEAAFLETVREQVTISIAQAKGTFKHMAKRTHKVLTE